MTRRLLPTAAALFALATAVCAEDAQKPGPEEAKVRQCVANLLDPCEWVALDSVKTTDRRVTETDAEVLAHIEVTVISSFAGGSPAAQECTGTHWDMDPSKVKSTEDQAMNVPGVGNILRMAPSADEGRHFILGQHLIVVKQLPFEKWESGWRCAAKEMSPIENGYYGELQPDLLPLKHGAYVDESVPCGQASNATLMWYDGLGFYYGRGFSHASFKTCSLKVEVHTGEDYTVGTTCQSSSKNIAVYRVKTPSEFSFIGADGHELAKYRLCEQSQLPQMWRGPSPY